MNTFIPTPIQQVSSIAGTGEQFIPRPLPSGAPLSSSKSSGAVEPNVFERKLLSELFEHIRDHETCQVKGTLLFDMPVHILARDVALPAPLDTISLDISNQIARGYYLQRAQKWAMTYSYGDNADYLKENPISHPFHMHTRVSLWNYNRSICVEMAPTWFVMYLGTASPDIVISIKSYEGVLPLLFAETYTDLARILFSLIEKGACSLYNGHEAFFSKSETHLLMALLSLGQERAVVSDIVEILRNICFVLLPFFTAQSREIYLGNIVPHGLEQDVAQEVAREVVPEPQSEDPAPWCVDTDSRSESDAGSVLLDSVAINIPVMMESDEESNEMTEDTDEFNDVFMTNPVFNPVFNGCTFNGGVFRGESFEENLA